jgi:hypothetical protein
MKFEKPQKGNPYGLTIKQHTFPRASIARFADSDGLVSVFHIATGKNLKLSPDDHLFCATRIWDQRAEEGYMKEIEDSFQSLAEAIIGERILAIGPVETPVVNDFFALWNIRAHRKAHPIPDRTIQGIVGPKRNLTKDEQEHLEKEHIGFARPDRTVPGRQLSGISIQMNLDAVRTQLADAQWGILRAYDGEFIVPDNSSNARIVPVTPTLCLFSPSANHILTQFQVAEINQYAAASSRDFYFARDFSQCPLLNLTTRSSRPA